MAIMVQDARGQWHFGKSIRHGLLTGITSVHAEVVRIGTSVMGRMRNAKKMFED